VLNSEKRALCGITYSQIMCKYFAHLLFVIIVLLRSNEGEERESLEIIFYPHMKRLKIIIFKKALYL